MCCSKHGSRSVSAIWRNGSIKVRESLASDLAPHEARLASDQFGHHSARDMGLSAFRRSRDDWRRSVEGADKKKELMKDFLVEDMKIGKAKAVKEEEEVGVKREVGSPEETSEPKKKKKKKEKPAKSYLDDL